MRGLPLGVGFGDQRAAQPIARIRQTEQPLALAHTQRHGITLLQTGGEAFPIPQIGLNPHRGWRLAHPATHFLQLLGGQPGRATRMVAFGQTGQPLPIKAPYPIDQRARRVAKEVGHLFATHPGSDEQDAMQTMIIAGVLMTVNLLLQHSAAVLRHRQR
jgi:hypothetical protein